MNPQIEAVLSAWVSVLTECVGDVEKVGRDIPIPQATPEMLVAICDQAIKLLKKSSTVVQLNAPIYIVGDIHGSLLDLIRIFTEIGRPSQVDYLFLGDYVDRGSFSIEVITMLLVAYVLHPTKLTLLRGNHELPEINKAYGFYNELVDVYDERADELYKKFNETFTYLPIAAVIENEMFCVHGGICPNLSGLSQIQLVQRPINVNKSNLIWNVLWADPTTVHSMFSESQRGDSIEFGENAVKYFLEATNMKWIIRAHQCVQHGIKVTLKNVVTVFSSSSYSEGDNNESGVLYVHPNKTFVPFKYPPIPKTLNRLNVLCFCLTNPKTSMTIDLASARKLPMSLSGTSITGLSHNSSRKGSMGNLFGPMMSGPKRTFKTRTKGYMAQSDASMESKLPSINQNKKPGIKSRPSMHNIHNIVNSAWGQNDDDDSN